VTCNPTVCNRLRAANSVHMYPPQGWSRIPFFAIHPSDSDSTACPSDPTRLSGPTALGVRLLPDPELLAPAVALRLKLVARAFRLSKSALPLPAEVLALRQRPCRQRNAFRHTEGPASYALEACPSIRSIRVGRVRPGESRIRLVGPTPPLTPPTHKVGVCSPQSSFCHSECCC